MPVRCRGLTVEEFSHIFPNQKPETLGLTSQVLMDPDREHVYVGYLVKDDGQFAQFGNIGKTYTLFPEINFNFDDAWNTVVDRVPDYDMSGRAFCPHLKYLEACEGRREMVEARGARVNRMENMERDERYLEETIEKNAAKVLDGVETKVDGPIGVATKVDGAAKVTSPNGFCGETEDREADALSEIQAMLKAEPHLITEAMKHTKLLKNTEQNHPLDLPGSMEAASSIERMEAASGGAADDGMDSDSSHMHTDSDSSDGLGIMEPSGKWKASHLPCALPRV